MYGSKANYAPETGTVTQGTIRSMYNAMMGNRLGKKRTIGYIDVTENMYYNNTIPENSDKLNEDINRDICTYRQYMELLGMPEKLISDTPTETIYRTEIAKLTSRNAYCNKKLIKSPYNEMFIKENAEIVGLYKKVMSDYANDVKE
jgi:hypothetical protein